MPIRNMQRFAQLRRGGESTVAARRALLEEHRDEVLERIAELQRGGLHSAGSLLVNGAALSRWVRSGLADAVINMPRRLAVRSAASVWKLAAPRLGRRP